MKISREQKRERLGWYFYDWANSAFSTTVATVFFGPYITILAKAAADEKGFVYPFGIPVTAGSFFPYLISLSVLFQVILLPFLGAIADYSHRRRRLLGISAYIGAIATMCMYFLQKESYLFGGFLFLIANVSFGASVVFYNAFLPEISSVDERDRVSSRGWAFGYLGGGILLALNLILFSQAGNIGLSESQAVRISLASAGIWWALFSIIPLVTLRQHHRPKDFSLSTGYMLTGFRQLRETLQSARQYPQTLSFLIAYLIYSDGIQTVITLSSEFGHQELNLPISTLTKAILLVQFVAFFGALAFGKIARHLGTKQTLIMSLFVWIGTLLYAYEFLYTSMQFFILAAVIAIVLGGSQALSRSLYSKMIPKGREAEYFGLYEISERGTSWLGPLFFGLALQLSGSYRLSLVSLAVFFIIGLILLNRVDTDKAIVESKENHP